MRRFLLFLLVALLSLLIACSSGDDQENKEPVDDSGDKVDKTDEEVTSGEAQEGGTIILGTSTEPETIDPHNTGQAAANSITGLMGASLVFQNPETMEFEPYLAESWEASDNGKTWTFELREDVKFHDGSELTAEDFVNTYERAQEAGFVAGSNLNELDSAEAADTHTLVLHMKEPFAPLLQYLSDPGWLQPLPSDAIDEGHDFGRDLID